LTTPELIKVAIVGAGYTAKEHIRAFADVPGVQIAGIHSRTRARAEALAKEFAIPHVCDSIAELYERTQAQLVVVTVVELSMNAVATACFDHPWAALLEKPPGYDLDDALAIQRAARAKSRRVHVALNRRSLGAMIDVTAQLADQPGARFIKLQDQQSQARALAGGQPPLVVKNWMFANSIHVIDYVRRLARGALTAVEQIRPYDPAAPGVVLLRLQYDSGDHALYEGIWHGPGPWAVTVTAGDRRWEMRPLEQAVTQKLGAPPQPLEAQRWDADFKPGFRRQAEWTIASLRGGDTGALATLDDGIESMRLVHAMFPNR
jgi:predicted dehydrogenase